MATILQFRRAEPVSEGAPPSQPPVGHMAEIIIFPGVRIERHSEPGRQIAGLQRNPHRPAQGE